jgi:hypothetical protein
VIRHQVEDYTRLYWHGYPEDFAQYRKHTLLRRYYLSKALDELIERHNDEGSGGRPKDER